MLRFYHYIFANIIIISGTDADMVAPYYAGIGYPRLSGLQCAAVVISDEHLLTAAQCMKYKTLSEYYIVIGSPWLKRKPKYSIRKYKNRPQFNNLTNDISVVTMYNLIIFRDHIHAIALPKATDRYKIGELAAVVTVENFEAAKQKDDVPILHRKRCAWKVRDHPSILCVGAPIYETETKKCSMLKGSPLVLNNKVIGLISYDNKCGVKTNAYTNIRRHLEFIYEATYVI